MKKNVNKQAKKASKQAKAEKLRKKQEDKAMGKSSEMRHAELVSASQTESLKTIHVKNAEGDPDTVAEIVVQNKIDYTPKVSVIIPVYNVEQYLRQCLDSVINQTLKEIEIICVDDGSTDSSLEILKEYAEKDKRITVMKQENLHAGVARNAGLAVAKGEYLSFLDSDDFFELNMLEEMSKKADEDGSDVVICGNYVYDEQKQGITRQVRIAKQFVEASPFAPQDFSDCLFNCCNPNPWNKLFKRILFNKYEIRYEKYIRVNDMTCVCTIMSAAKKIGVVDFPFITYRSNQIGNVTSNRSEKVDCFLYAIAKLEDNLKRINNYNTYKEAFMKRVSDSFRWEMSVCNREQQEQIKQKAQKILSKELYNQLFDIKVSVIIPVYNVEKYLRECLDSVINQTLEDIEIICVNDGSTDNSLKILDKYALKDKRIIIITQKNQGLSCSRNNALKIAKGEYIVFVDSDDYLRLDALEIIYQNMTEKQLDILSYGGINFDNNTRVEKINQYWEFGYLPKDFNYQKFNYKNCLSFLHSMAVSSCLTAYSRSVIKNYSITFPEHLFFEDNLFFLKSITQARFCGIIKDKLYYRRIHNKSITQNWDKHFSDYLQVSDMVIEYVSEKVPDLYSTYRQAYLSRCVNIWREFDQKNQRKYEKALRKLLEKYNFTTDYVKTSVSLLAYLCFPYYKSKLNSLSIELGLRLLSSMWVDIKNFGTAENSVSVVAKNMRINQPDWFTDAQGIGTVAVSSALTQKMTIQAHKNGNLRFDFRGADKRYNNERFPVWIDYKSIKIDGREILSAPVATWHDKPYHYEMPVKDGQTVSVEIEQQPHQYTKDELKDLILKLNPNDAYIASHVAKIVEIIAKNNKPHKGLGYFIFHKKKTEKYKKIYLFGLPVWKKKVSIYKYLDNRLAEITKAQTNQIQALSNQIKALQSGLQNQLNTQNAAYVENAANLSAQAKVFNDTISEQINATQKKLADFSSRNQQNYQELNFADLLHNTIINSAWLKDNQSI